MIDEDPIPPEYRIHAMHDKCIADNGMTEATGQEIGWVWVGEFNTYKAAVRGCWAHRQEL